MRRQARWIALAIGLVLGIAMMASSAGASPTQRWSDEVVDALSHVPIQDEGRVKPLSTFAIFELVRISGRMHIRSPEGEKVTAMHWLLDCLFYPEIGREYEAILIENPQVMQELHLDDSNKRRRFKLSEIEPVAQHLLDRAREYAEIEDSRRTLFQRQILQLWDAYATYQDLLHAFDFARVHHDVPAGSTLAGLLSASGMPYAQPDGGYHLHYSQLLAELPRLLTILQVQRQELGDGATVETGLTELLARIDHAARNSPILTLLPPLTHPGEETWLAPGTLLQAQLDSSVPLAREIEMVAMLEHLLENLGDPAAFERHATQVAARLKAGAVERGEYRFIGLEVFYYRLRPFYWSLVLFVLSALVVTALWIAPRSRLLAGAAWTSVLIPTLLVIAGITLRCIIRGRPPVTTLYETTLFIPAVAVVVALITEWINRRRIAMSVAAAIGCIGLFLAHNYELRGPDTMESMIAVLDSNFWLSTHVTTVTIGYSAGLLAAVLAHVYIFGQALGLGARHRDFFRSIARMTYGVICFGTLFAFVGTVLGGIWANNSWGRFWGWDPKENGALLIILWFLFILHARLGGYVRDMGIAVCSIIGGMIVAFSWWGVNLLAVGLHSYGFIDGVQRSLTAFYLTQIAVLAVAGYAWVMRRRAGEAGAQASGRSARGGLAGSQPQTGA